MLGNCYNQNMYITSKWRALGDSSPGSDTLDPSQQSSITQIATLQVQTIMPPSGISYVDKINALQPFVSNRNYSGLKDAITNLLADPQLLPNAGTLIDPLNAILQTINNTKDPTTIDNSTIQKVLTTCGILAKNEALANPSQRDKNAAKLQSRIDKLNLAISNFQTNNSGIWAIYNRISGKSKEMYTPIQQEEDTIANDIKIQPLLFEDRTQLLAQIRKTEQSASMALKLAAGSSILFIGYIIFEILKAGAAKGATAAYQWGVGKAKEVAVKKAAHHAKRLRAKYVGKPKKKTKKKSKSKKETK